MGKRDPRVDAYIARSAEFARPILAHLRHLVHAGCPEVEETLKWGSPYFLYKGMLCGMAAFKGHCAFGFWKEALLRDRVKGMAAPGEPGMGQFGRITAVSDLPGETILRRLVKAAVDLNDRGIKSPARSRPKGDKTRKRRLETAVAWMAEGKARNWKYLRR